ncbi:MAG: hypothetical protein AB7O71_18285 [Hyphomicrobiaceae bacterium]
MRRIAFILTGLLTLVALAWLGGPGAWASSPKREIAFTSPQMILGWINQYRAHPEPQRLPKAVKAMSSLGVFRDLDSSGVYIGFMAGVLGANPERADKLVAGMFPMPPEDQVAVVRAIAYSGLPDWRMLLGRFAERMPARAVLIKRLTEGKLPTLEKLPIDTTPAALDTLWGYYFANGRKAPINRIIEALQWATEGNDVDKLTAGSMAKWTLANNALQSKDLLDHLKAEQKRRPKAITIQLGEVIEAAETYETSQIRKRALAAIEELKRKGPESARKMSYWGMAGQTALALGCVVAGAMGHVEIAVPCVIGGAASSAAIKLITPQ